MQYIYCDIQYIYYLLIHYSDHLEESWRVFYIQQSFQNNSCVFDLCHQIQTFCIVKKKKKNSKQTNKQINKNN